MKRSALALVVLAAFFAGCGGDDGDTVVGVILKCDARTFVGGSVEYEFREESGKNCEGTSSVRRQNYRQEVTVKSASKTYLVTVPRDATVTLGQSWPPH